MKRLRNIGLCAVAALALTAVLGTSSASANYFSSNVPGAQFSGSGTGAKHILSLGTESFGCEKVSFSGTMPSSMLQKIRVSPELSQCIRTPGFYVGWSMRGCRYRFDAGTVPTLVGSVDIVDCEPSMVFSDAGLCELTIGNQNNLGTVEYKNSIENGIPVVTVSAHLENIKYTRKGGGCAGASGTYTNGKYTGEWKLKGTGGVGIQVQSSEETLPARFIGEEVPMTVDGTNVGSKAFNFGNNGYLWCDNYTYSGASGPAAATSLSVTPSYHSCTWYWQSTGFNAPVPDEDVQTGGCSFTLHAAGGVDIGGSSCAASPLTVTLPGCVITVGPQSFSSGITYTNEGSGKLRSVKVAGSAQAALEYSATGGSCIQQGTFGNGYFINRVSLGATNSSEEAQGLSIE